MRWLEIAWGHLGTRETPGAAATPDILQWFRDVGHPAVTSDEVPNCAAFVGSCLVRAGLPLDKIPLERRLLARSYLEIGTPIAEPRVGALGVFSRGADPTFGHVGWITRWSADTITLLGANQGDQVNETAYPRARLVGIRWPEAVSSKDLDAAGSRITAAAARQRLDGAKAGTVVTTGQLPPAPAPGQRIGTLREWADTAVEWKGLVGTIEQLLLFLWSKWPVIALLLSSYWLARMAWSAGWIRAWRADDASTGAHVGRAAGTEA